MKLYIDPEKPKTFRNKSKATQKLINTTLFILESFGIPVDQTPRKLEKMAIAFLACGNITKVEDFKLAEDLNSSFYRTSREVIKFVNKHFNENISPGSYDDIRRQDLRFLTTANVILKSSPNSATNAPTRGYSINPVYAELVRNHGEKNWHDLVKDTLKDKEYLSQKLKRERDLQKVTVTLEEGTTLEFSAGAHNDLQKSIIEDFLPRYGFGAELLYVGDTKKKYLYHQKDKLKELNFFELSHQELPDIVAYSKTKNWIYLIEAVHSSGAIDEIKLIQFQKLTKKCKAEMIYVTAFLDRPTFRKFMTDIAWETEVWIAANPDHLIHFNGDKFLGPYK